MRPRAARSRTGGPYRRPAESPLLARTREQKDTIGRLAKPWIGRSTISTQDLANGEVSMIVEDHDGIIVALWTIAEDGTETEVGS